MISLYPVWILGSGGDLFNYVPGVGMSMRVIANFLATALIVLLAAPASATVMTFKDLLPVSTDNGDYRENGITASSAGELGYFDLPGAAHLDDSGTSIAKFVSFTMSSRFSAIGFDILPLGTEFCAAGGSGACNDPYENVLIQGFRDGALVAEDAFFGGESPSTYLFSSDYLNLDQLIIGALLPNTAVIGGFCDGLPCGHFNIDNVELSAVPLPAALPLFSAALGLLGFLGWRRRRTGGAIA